MSRISIPAGQHRPKQGPPSTKRAERCPRCGQWCRQKPGSKKPGGVETKQCVSCKSVYDVEVVRQQANSDYERLSKYRDRVRK